MILDLTVTVLLVSLITIILPKLNLTSKITTSLILPFPVGLATFKASVILRLSLF